MTDQLKKRTLQQNKALWKYFELLADELNSGGYDMRKTLKHTIDIPWDKNTICEFIWRPVQEAQLGKKSTTDLTTSEIDKIYETINRYLGEKTGVFVDFPSDESPLI